MEITSKFYLSLFTLKQASRRSWRIGQTENVKVIFMAYADTPQHKALELIGAKVASANSLEGRLSGDDDLSSMADEEDNIQLALAKAILKGESSSKDIQMSSIKNFGNDRDWDSFEVWYKEKIDSLKQTTIIPKEEVEVIGELTKTSFEASLFDQINDNLFINNEDSLLDSLNVSDKSKSTEQTFFYYSGKGKKQRKVEVSSANITDCLSLEELKGGVQLSLF